jgi:hypothetical protein
MEKLFDDDYIYGLLLTIVENNHTHPAKKEVRRKAGGGFQIACPYCGDSEKTPSKFRGNLNKLLYYKCFNDGCEKKTHFTSMAKDFNIQIDGDTKRKLYDYLDQQASRIDTLQDELAENGLNHLINLEDLTECINSRKCDTKLSNFKPIQKGSAQFFYLADNRKITDMKLWTNIYQADFNVTQSWTEKVIVFLNRRGNKIIGMQVRNLKSGYKRLFHIYTFQDLYEWLGGEELSDGQLIMYNKLSYYYGILNVNFNKEITLFEGYGDALLYPNSIGVVGVNTDLKFFEENGLDLKYFYDNDSAGHRKTEEKIKAGFSCFLWKKLFEWIVGKKNSFDPYYHMNKISNVKDLTKLNGLVPGCYEKLELYNHFSVDQYDLKYVPKVKKVYRKI